MITGVRVIRPTIAVIGLLLVACSSSSVSPVDVTDAVVASATNVVYVPPITAIDVSADGSYLGVGGGTGIYLYSTKPGLQQVWYQPLQGIENLSFSHNGEQIVAIEDTGQILLLDIQTGDVTSALRVSGIGPTSAALSPDGMLLAIATLDAKVIIWDVVEEQQVQVWGRAGFSIQPNDSTDAITFDWSSDGHYLAVGGWSAEVLVWDIITEQVYQQLTGPFGEDSEVDAIALSPDDRYLVASYMGQFQLAIWDLHKGSLVTPGQTQPSIYGSLYGLRWSPDGARVVGTSDGEELVFWNAPDLSSAIQIDPFEESNLPGAWIRGIQWSPDGTKLYMGISDGRIMVWDAEAHQVLELVPLDSD
jgi:WD40 repeat protein